MISPEVGGGNLDGIALEEDANDGPCAVWSGGWEKRLSKMVRIVEERSVNRKLGTILRLRTTIDFMHVSMALYKSAPSM